MKKYRGKEAFTCSNEGTTHVVDVFGDMGVCPLCESEMAKIKEFESDEEWAEA